MKTGRICGACWQRNGQHLPGCPRRIPASLVAAAMGGEQAADAELVMACPAPAEPDAYDLQGALERLHLVVSYARRKGGTS